MSTANLIQAARGPVLLITLGVLLVIDHFGGPGFWRMSPLLLVIYGVMKLLERVARPEYDSQYAGPASPGAGRGA